MIPQERAYHPNSDISIFDDNREKSIVVEFSTNRCMEEIFEFSKGSNPKYTESLASADFSGAVITCAYFQKIAQAYLMRF